MDLQNICLFATQDRKGESRTSQSDLIDPDHSGVHCTPLPLALMCVVVWSHVEHDERPPAGKILSYMAWTIGFCTRRNYKLLTCNFETPAGWMDVIRGLESHRTNLLASSKTFTLARGTSTFCFSLKTVFILGVGLKKQNCFMS